MRLLEAQRPHPDPPSALFCRKSFLPPLETIGLHLSTLSCHPPSRPIFPVDSMAGNSRVEFFLGKAGLRPPKPISHPQAPQAPIFDGLLSDTELKNAARSLLVKQRIVSPNFRPPEQQKRHHFRTQKQKDAASRGEGWVFTKHEIAKAFDSLLSQEPQASLGLLRSLLAHAPPQTLQELWCHLQDPGLEKKQTRKGQVGVDPTSPTPGLSWLEKAVNLGHLNHISLLCEDQLSQDVLDRAFGHALSVCAMDSMKLLLSFGATATVRRDIIRKYVRYRNIAIVRLLISAPGSMDAESWQHCIEPEFACSKPLDEGFISILMCCCAFRPDIISDSLFLGALESQNFEATAIMVAYTGTRTKLSVRDAACERATRIRNHERRLAFFSLLSEAEMVSDNRACQLELARDAESGCVELVRLLAASGVAVDYPPEYPFYTAVARLDYEMIDALRHGRFTSPVSAALGHVPEDISGPDMLRLISILGPMGLSGTDLDPYLPPAVDTRHVKLIATLLFYGASVEYDSAAAIRSAVGQPDFNILAILLERDCLPHILSGVVPPAMALPSRPNRLRVMRALLEKGVCKQKLGKCAEILASESDLDVELIRLLVGHQLPLDDGELLAAVVRSGNMDLLLAMCETGLRGETLSYGVLAAIGAVGSLVYGLVLEMVKMLLQKGAYGPLVDEALFQATIRDKSLHIVRALLHHGADANHEGGVSYTEAVRRGNLGLLEILQAGCNPNQVSIDSLFFTVVEPAYYDPELLECILRSAATSAGTRGRFAWDVNHFINHQNLSEIILRVVHHGLYIHEWSECLLPWAITATDFNLLADILYNVPGLCNKAMSAAFKEARQVESRVLQVELMSLLLIRASSLEDYEIGQSQALTQETKAALDGDSTGLLLLLSHQASVDFNQGMPVRMASTAGSIEVLDALLSADACLSTVVSALAETITAVMSPDKRHGILCRLLNTNLEIPASWMSKTLHSTVLANPCHTELTQLLIVHGAKASPGLLRAALQSCSKEVFEILASSIVDLAIATEIFHWARGLELDDNRRYWAYSALLDNGPGVTVYEISEAFIDSFGSSGSPPKSEISKLLLAHGAAVGHRNAAAFGIALGSADLDAFRLLCQFITDDATANLAFQSVRKAKALSEKNTYEAYSRLLPSQWHITPPQLYAALVHSIKQSRGKVTETIRLLLHSGANPNSNNAKCFLLACDVSYVKVFSALCQYADPEIVFRRLIPHFQFSAALATLWIREFVVATPRERRTFGKTPNPDGKPLLFQCLQTFPSNSELPGILLDYGVPDSNKMEISLRKEWPAEACNALLWAMFSEPQVDNIIIECLLGRGSPGQFVITSIAAGRA